MCTLIDNPPVKGDGGGGGGSDGDSETFAGKQIGNRDGLSGETGGSDEDLGISGNGRVSDDHFTQQGFESGGADGRSEGTL